MPAVPDLVRVIQEPVPAHDLPPASCVHALGAIGDSRPEVVAALLIALRNPEINMRHQAATALGKLPVASRQIVMALEAAIEKDPESVEIATALENVRGLFDSGARAGGLKPPSN